GQDLDGLGRPVLRRRRPVHIPEEQDPIGAARGLDQHQRVEPPFLCVRHEPADVVPLPPLLQERRHPRHHEHRHQTHHPPRPDPEPSTAQPPTRPSPAPPDLLPHALLPLSLPRHRRILQPPGRVPPLRAFYYCFSLSRRRLTGSAATTQHGVRILRRGHLVRGITAPRPRAAQPWPTQEYGTMRFSRWLIPASLLSLAACGAGDAGSALETRRLEAVQERRIGSVDDPGTYLTRFDHLVVAPDGRIY